MTFAQIAIDLIILVATSGVWEDGIGEIGRINVERALPTTDWNRNFKDTMTSLLIFRDGVGDDEDARLDDGIAGEDIITIQLVAVQSLNTSAELDAACVEFEIDKAHEKGLRIAVLAIPAVVLSVMAVATRLFEVFQPISAVRIRHRTVYIDHGSNPSLPTLWASSSLALIGELPP